MENKEMTITQAMETLIGKTLIGNNKKALPIMIVGIAENGWAICGKKDSKHLTFDDCLLEQDIIDFALGRKKYGAYIKELYMNPK